jgi:penicillin-binding protein 1A
MMVPNRKSLSSSLRICDGRPDGLRSSGTIQKMGFVIFVRRAALVMLLVPASIAIGLVSLPWTVQILVPTAPVLNGGNAQIPSTILDINGKVLATVSSLEQYQPLPEGALPPILEKVVIASEDTRFYSHHGFDLIGTARALYRNIRSGGVVEGGSTITQQVVKNDVVGSRRSIDRKIREALLALRLEQDYTKDQILRRYLDVAYFGNGLRGVEVTAQNWFGVPADKVTLSQAALLVAVIPSPASYNPFNHPERAEQRRQLVLDVVEASGQFTSRMIMQARQDVPTPNRPADRELVSTTHPWVLDVVRSELRRLAPEVDLLTGGFEVRTGIDVDLQRDAEKALTRALDKEGMPNGAIVTLDAKSGEVRAIVGGVNRAKSEVNVALGALGGGSGRQAGSSFKPVVLAAAIESGWSIDDRISAPAFLPLPGREPAWNYDRRNWGTPTLDTATRWSVNTAYMNLTRSVGVAKVQHMARVLGLDPRAEGVEIAIGTDEVSPLTLAAAYAAFEDEGRWHTPHLVTEVLQDGERVWVPTVETRQAMAPETAEQVAETLRNVVDYGTGTRAQVSGVEVAGKTGTTDNYADAWFTGWGEGLVATVWVGHLEGQIPMRSVPGWGSISGGSLPAHIWKDSLRKALSERVKLRELVVNVPNDDATGRSGSEQENSESYPRDEDTSGRGDTGAGDDTGGAQSEPSSPEASPTGQPSPSENTDSAGPDPSAEPVEEQSTTAGPANIDTPKQN